MNLNRHPPYKVALKMKELEVYQALWVWKKPKKKKKKNAKKLPTEFARGNMNASARRQIANLVIANTLKTILTIKNVIPVHNVTRAHTWTANISANLHNYAYRWAVQLSLFSGVPSECKRAPIGWSVRTTLCAMLFFVYLIDVVVRFFAHFQGQQRLWAFFHLF